MNRLYLAGGALLVIIVLALVALSQHDGKVRASINADMSTQVISEAVAERKADLKADAQAQVKKGAALDTVRAAIIPVRKANAIPRRTKEVPAGVVVQVAPTDPRDAWVGVFNDAVHASNDAIERSTSNLP